MLNPKIITSLEEFKNTQSNYGAYLESTRAHIIKAYFNACGYNTLESNIDGVDCDFAIQLPHSEILKIQLKARPTCDEKYLNRELYIMCPLDAHDSIYDDRYVIMPHDKLYELIFSHYHNAKSNSYSFPITPEKLIPQLIKLSIVKPFSPIKELEKTKSYL